MEARFKLQASKAVYLVWSRRAEVLRMLSTRLVVRGQLQDRNALAFRVGLPSLAW